MDRIEAQPSIVVCPARLTKSSIKTHEWFIGTHKYSGADIYTSVQRGVALQNVDETRGKNKYPHSFDNDDSKGNKLAFPDYCPADKKRMEFPLITPPPYDGGKNNVKQGDERVVYYYTPGDRTSDGNPNVEYCGIMTHVGATPGGFFLC
ncbi:MAG: hypothetical protein LQ349_006445 [Xanthoria aureola]|nr:MAG: hypothetical protein LQ349_006445 [Xanthoria aureola]